MTATEAADMDDSSKVEIASGQERPRNDNLYDLVPYASESFLETHPDRLATMATLFGMSPAPVERCRVLEIGCASGGNLIPMAYGLPGSEFVGVDYSAREIAQGREILDELGIRNVRLEHLNLIEITPEWGEFDYIIAHGVYSWVPPEVQDRLLQVCKQNLAANGVAYVSYNAYPGCHMLRIPREMMLYHTRGLDDPRERIAQARAVMRTMAEVVGEGKNAYTSFLRAYTSLYHERGENLTEEGREALVLHDDLAEFNMPLYFYQFAARAEAAGLQYLSEASYHMTQPSEFPPEMAEKLSDLARDRIELEQYLDFARNRTFRKTLLCHREVVLSHKMGPERLLPMYLASHSESVADELDVTSPAVEQFRGADGRILSTDHPVSKVALLYLGSMWPRSARFDELLAQARAYLGLDAGADGWAMDAAGLAQTVLSAYACSSELIELHVHAPAFRASTESGPDECPLASLWARLQARKQDHVTNMRHERVQLDPFARYLLLHLDGRHDRAALIERFLHGPVASGALHPEQDGKPIDDADQARTWLAGRLEAYLQRLATMALLLEMGGE